MSIDPIPVTGSSSPLSQSVNRNSLQISERTSELSEIIEDSCEQINDCLLRRLREEETGGLDTSLRTRFSPATKKRNVAQLNASPEEVEPVRKKTLGNVKHQEQLLGAFSGTRRKK